MFGILPESHCLTLFGLMEKFARSQKIFGAKNKSSVSFEMMPAPITFIIKAANNILKMTLVFHILFSHCFPIQIFAAMFVFYCHLTPNTENMRIHKEKIWVFTKRQYKVLKWKYEVFKEKIWRFLKCWWPWVKSSQAGWLLMEKFAFNRKFLQNLAKTFWFQK